MLEVSTEQGGSGRKEQNPSSHNEQTPLLFSRHQGKLEGTFTKGLKIMEEFGKDIGTPSMLCYGDARSELGNK